jgi:hypothetical protein
MNKKKAIRIINEQKEKIRNNPELRNTQWNFQTASYIKDIFGKDSTEYSWISQFKWTVTYVSVNDETPSYVKSEIASKPKKAIQFLDNCLDVIENKGVFKEKKENWFSGKKNWQIISVLIGVGLFGFGIGYWVKEFELFSIIYRKINP